MPVILADLGGLFAIGFLLISFIGWILNLINSQNPPPAPNRGPQRKPRARDKKVQNEIEQFLQEAMGNKKEAPDEEDPDDVEVLEPAPRRRPPQQREPQRQTRPAPQTQQRPAPIPIPPARQQPGTTVSSRHMPASQSTGTGVSSHVTEHMTERVGRGIEQHLPHSVDQTVSQHLGLFTADDHDPRSTVKTTYRSRADVPDATELIQSLRNRAGMRKAILLHEILSKPRALRK